MADDTAPGLEEDVAVVSVLHRRSKSARDKSSLERGKESHKQLRRRPTSIDSNSQNKPSNTIPRESVSRMSGEGGSVGDRDSGVSLGDSSPVYQTSSSLEDAGNSLGDPSALSMESVEENANLQAWTIPDKPETPPSTPENFKPIPPQVTGSTIDVSRSSQGLDCQSEAEDADWSVSEVAWGVTQLLLSTIWGLLGSLVKIGRGLVITAVDYFTDHQTHEDKVVPVPAESSNKDEEKQDGHDDPRDRVYHICNELMTTEEVYVERLGILVTVKEKTGKLLGSDVASQMFRDVEVIHQFHRDNLLPQLQERMAHWTQHKKIGDVMKKLAPFLKLYTAYVKDYEKASALVDSYEIKHSAFASLLKDVIASHETGNSPHRRLKVQSHMMEPVQRVPRYVLLLRDYLKRLPSDAPDREDTEKALESVSEAARHFENMMKRDSTIGKLLEIQKSLDGHVNITRGQRELVKEGKLHMVKPTKISEKYIFLFTDMLLITNKQILAVVGKYKVKDTLDLHEAQVVDGTNLDVPSCFCVRTKDATVEFCCQDQDEKDQWYEKIHRLIGVLSNEGDTSRQDSGIDLDKSTCTVGAGEAQLRGNLQLSSDEGRSWKKRLFTLYDSGRLEACKASHEQESLRTPAMLSLLEFRAVMIDAPGSKKCKAIRLTGLGKDYYLVEDNVKVLDKWFESLQKYIQSPCLDIEENTS